jgi:rare lipoprotein A
MSISDLSRPCAATGGYTSKLAARLACAMIVAASFLISAAGQAKPSLDIDESAPLNLSGARSINKSSSFSSRFDCSQTSFIVEMLDCPAAGKPQAFVPAGEEFIGIASTYNPNDPKDRFAGSGRTSTGELYDGDNWTAAIRTDLRWHFGGVRYGRNYQPVFALVEGAGKKVIVRINDVGPLRPGRIIDLNARTMHYFDPSLKAGLIQDVKVTPLFADDLAVGPVEPTQKVLAGDFEHFFSAPDLMRDFDDHSQLRPLLFLR